MPTISTQAYLIHKQPQGDTSLCLYCFTREKGLMTIYYRGGRAVKKRTLPEPFIPLWCTIHERRSVYYLNAIEMNELPFVLSGFSLFSGLYLNELIYYTLPHDEPEEVLYCVYETTLAYLSEAKEMAAIEMALRRFEMQLLKSVGYGLNWQYDAAEALIDADRRYHYQPGSGFMASQDGFYGHDILAIAKDLLETKTQLLTAKRILRQAIAHLLGGRKLASRDLLRLKY